MMKVSKVKWDGTELQLEYETPMPKGRGTKTTQVKCNDLPHADLVAALDAFHGYAKRVLCFSNSYAESCGVRGVTITHEKDGRHGLTVTLLKELETSNSPAVFNTPYLRQQLDPETDKGPHWLKAGDLSLIDALAEEARLYVAGKRAQGDLFQQPAEEPAEVGA